MVQHVEKLTSKLETNALGDFRGLVYAEVNIICARTIKIATGQHITRERTEIGDTRDGVHVAAVKVAGRKGKVIEKICCPAGVHLCGASPPQCGGLERSRTSGERVRAIEHGKREATANRDDRGDRPSIEESLFRTRHVPCERDVPGAGEYEAMTLIKIGVAFVNLGIERIEKPEICVVVGLAEGGADIVDSVGIRIARMQA